MSIQSPAYVISADSHSAALFRQTSQTMIAGAGIADAASLAVTQTSVASMGINVAAGEIWMPGTLGATAGYGNNSTAQTAYGLPAGKTSQGMYCAYNDGTVNLAISASDPSNPRIDLICSSVQDAQYAGATNTPVLQVVTGTPGASPAAPAAPATTTVLAQILVGTGVTTIVTANITDERPRMTLATISPIMTYSYSGSPIAGATYNSALPVNIAVERRNSTTDSNGLVTKAITSSSLLAATATYESNTSTEFEFKCRYDLCTTSLAVWQMYESKTVIDVSTAFVAELRVEYQ